MALGNENEGKMVQEWYRGEYTISTDRRRLDLDVIHGFLSNSYWAKGRTRDRILRSIECSLPFGLYHQETQVGFARVLTDYVALAFLADVFVLGPHRGKALGAWLVEAATGHPELHSVRRWLLGTRDAHGFYRKFGFAELKPGVFMEKLDPESDRRFLES
jgi:GNAT superfamily N-acetyltransferase